MIPFPWYDELEDHEDRLDPEFTRGKLRVIAFPSSSSDELEIRLDFELNDDELALMEDECASIDELPILSSFRFDNELESPITGATGAFDAVFPVNPPVMPPISITPPAPIAPKSMLPNPAIIWAISPLFALTVNVITP